MMEPLISIIVPCLNAEKYIEACISSIVNQVDCSFEIIVIDGGSTDDTLKKLTKYRNAIKTIISEPDFGQSNAINKGLSYCSGDIFSWLNADDYYAEGALSEISKAYISNPLTIISGKTRFFGGIHGTSGSYVLPQNLNFEDVLTIWKRSFTWAQPSTFFPLESHVEIDENLHLAMDYDLLLKMLLRYKSTIIHKTIANFRVHPDAKTNVLGYRNAIELPLIIDSHKNSSANFDNNEYLKFKSRCQMILVKNSILKKDLIHAFRYICLAFRHSFTQPIIMIVEYLHKNFLSNSKSKFDSFKVKNL